MPDAARAPYPAYVLMPAKMVNYCTEAPFIQTLCPTLVLGPGSINQAHQPDEYLETRFIKPTRELITQVIHHFCWH